MPAEPLFDYTALDQAAVAVSPQRVGEINPQCGDMRQLDYLIWTSADFTEGLGVKQVRDDEFWVPYHIPGRPIYPGVLMIEASAQLSSVLFTLKGIKGFLGFTRCDDVAFRGQVVPGDTLYLLARELDFKRRRFISVNQAFVNDTLVLEAKITGMVL